LTLLKPSSKPRAISRRAWEVTACISGFSTRRQGGATLSLVGTPKHPKGFLLRLPESLEAKVTVNDHMISTFSDHEFILPSDMAEAHVTFGQ